MSALEQFILAWIAIIVILAAYSWHYNRRERQWRDLESAVEDIEMQEADAWCKQHILNTVNFHRADRYYREFR